MFKIINPKKTIRFMSFAKLATSLAMALVIASFVIVGVKGLNFGLDFTGGVTLEVEYPNDIELKDVRSKIESLKIDSPVVQHFGSSKIAMIRIKPVEGMDQKVLSTKIFDSVKTLQDGAVLNRVEYVGPSVGSDLVESGIISVFVSLLCILAYVAFRFEWRMATGAVVALVHDTIITLAVFSLFDLEFDLTVLAAVLTIIGYSLNDTIVVFDRIREKARLLRDKSIPEIINVSITETLSRTVITSGTTMFTVLALLFLGGPMIFGFSFALAVGIIVGTFSSIYVASGLAYFLGMTRDNLLPPPPPVRGDDEEFVETLDE